jgi:hypothetical protein
LYGALIMISIILLAGSCDSMKRMQKKEDRRIAASKKQIEQKQSARDKEYQKLAERQKRIQTKETRKQMKDLEKRSKRWRDGKPQETRFERWTNKMSEKFERKRRRRRD